MLFVFGEKDVVGVLLAGRERKLTCESSKTQTGNGNPNTGEA
jgi:hypothetical protein